jgi:hypothetical protein
MNNLTNFNLLKKKLNKKLFHHFKNSLKNYTQKTKEEIKAKVIKHNIKTVTMVLFF